MPFMALSLHLWDSVLSCFARWRAVRADYPPSVKQASPLGFGSSTCNSSSSSAPAAQQGCRGLAGAGDRHCFCFVSRHLLPPQTPCRCWAPGVWSTFTARATPASSASASHAA